MEQGNASSVVSTTTMSTAGSNAALGAASHPLQDVALEAVKIDVDMKDIDNIDRSAEAKVKSAIPSQIKKANWVKFDDEVGETGENSIKNSDFDIIGNATRAPTTTAANKLSPLPPPDKKRQQTSVAASSPTSSSGVTTTSSSTPKVSIPVQREPLSTPVQGSTIAPSSMPDIAPAILTTESTHVNLNGSGRTQQHHSLQQQHQTKSTAGVVSVAAASHPHHQWPRHSNIEPSSSTGETYIPIAIPTESAPGMRTIELSTGRIREGFANGDVIVTLLPANTKWPWITPAIFRPELVPEELMAQGLTLTVEEYVNAMETLVNDYRFTVYNICYKRILVCWIIFAFAVLLTLLFSGLQGVALFSLGVGWLFLNAAAIFFCMWVKLRLSRGLEKCLARVNKQLMKHKILLVLDDRGRISCHKVNLCFMYFDPMQCIKFLNEFLEQTEHSGGEAIKAGWEAKLDIDVNDIVIQGNNPVRLSRKQAVAQELFLTYLQRWGKDFLRRRLDWTVQEAGVHETPRHLQSSICPCQYEEEILRNKIKTHLKGRQCCGINCIGCWI